MHDFSGVTWLCDGDPSAHSTSRYTTNDLRMVETITSHHSSRTAARNAALHPKATTFLALSYHYTHFPSPKQICRPPHPPLTIRHDRPQSPGRRLRVSRKTCIPTRGDSPAGDVSTSHLSGREPVRRVDPASAGSHYAFSPSPHSASLHHARGRRCSPLCHPSAHHKRLGWNALGLLTEGDGRRSARQ